MLTGKTYTRTDKRLYTVTVDANGETEVDVGGATVGFTGDAVKQAEQFACLMSAPESVELVEIPNDSTMIVEATFVVDLHDEAKSYDLLRRMSGY